jgi:hypothetical protein
VEDSIQVVAALPGSATLEPLQMITCGSKHATYSSRETGRVVATWVPGRMDLTPAASTSR